MKTLKLITAVIAILFLSNLTYAGSPKVTSPEDNLADLLIEKMGKDVTLTDSQKVVVKQKLTKYIVKVQNAHALSNSNEKFTKKAQASNEYQLSLDSILTNTQREQLNIKIKEREEAK
ncbi:MAG: hypothetical protein PHR83_05920 [Paludibacter sp.]|nr:hypothetical protein [Paludibacter sp.]